MSDRYITEKKTQMQYRIDKFKKAHNYIPDLNKDPSGRTGTIVGDDGKRVDFQFNGGTTKKSKVARYNDDGAYYDNINRKIHMSNSNFNSPVKGADNFTFNHEYGHRKIHNIYDDATKELTQHPKQTTQYMNDKLQNFKNVYSKAKNYGSENNIYKNQHDIDPDEVLADVNGITHTKNGEKVMRKHFQDINKADHKGFNHQANNTYLKIKHERPFMNNAINSLKNQKDQIQSQKYYSQNERQQQDQNIQNINNKIRKLNSLQHLKGPKDTRRMFSDGTGNTAYYRAKSNLQAAKDPVLRNYMQ